MFWYDNMADTEWGYQGTIVNMIKTIPNLIQFIVKTDTHNL